MMMKKTAFLLLSLFGFGFASAQYSHFDASVGLQHGDITTADIDNDGDLDIIVSGVNTESGVQVSKSYIYLNNSGVYELQGAGTGATYYQNPVFEPDVADPSVIRGGDGWFYAYGTENTWTDGIHHLVPVIKSKNLVQWQFVKDAFTTRPTWKSAGGIWAPDVTYMNGRYYMFYSVSTWGDTNPGIGLAISNYPYGPFTDQGKIFDSSSIGVSNSIDPNFFQTGTGDSIKSYLFWGSFSGIYGIQLGANYKQSVSCKRNCGNKHKRPIL
jgi:beta-xylosidase